MEVAAGRSCTHRDVGDEIHKTKHDTLMARDCQKERSGLVSSKKLQHSNKSLCFYYSEKLSSYTKEHIFFPLWLFPLLSLSEHHSIQSARKVPHIHCARVSIQNVFWK